jgi:hypothetical protein
MCDFFSSMFIYLQIEFFIHFKNKRGFTNVMIETDSKNMADTIHFMYSGMSKFSSIITKIKCILSLHSDFEVKSIKRQVNIIIHTITRAIISWSSRYLFKMIPPYIEQLLYNNEMMCVSSCQKNKIK